VREFTKNGFEWSYEGPEPRQLALALLADHLGDDAAAMASVEPFMRSVVANFGNEWEMTSADIDQALAALSGKTRPEMTLTDPNSGVERLACEILDVVDQPV